MWHMNAAIINCLCVCPVVVLLQVERAIQDKQSAIVRAQGEAQSARLIGQAIQHNPAFLTLRKIEVSVEASGARDRVLGVGFGGFCRWTSRPAKPRLLDAA
jgi:hypothetical protein